MNTDGKILKALEALQTDVKDVKQGQIRLEDRQARLEAIVEALKAGQDEIRDTMATEASVMDLRAKVDRITRNHERRIEELENDAGIPYPHKH